jgi:hypothetical protein
MVPADLIPLSVLQLDLDPPSVGGWAAYLADRGIAIVLDDIGRAAVSRQDAKMLIAERREAEARQPEAAARRDVELEAQRMRSLRPCVPACAVPEGLSPAVRGWRLLMRSAHAD